MANVYKNRIEDLAEAFLELRWSEMQEIAEHFAGLDLVEVNTADSSFWASIVHDWATQKMFEYEQRRKGE